MARVVIRDLCKAFGTTEAVIGFSLDVADGEFVSLLGPSGCGKTTTLRMIAGLETPSAGEIIIGDRVVSAPARGILVAPEARRLGMVFQSYAVWPHMTVRENVAFPLRISRVPARVREARVVDALAMVKLDGLGARYPHELSGGQQQRVALARALVMEPEGLLLDEPLSNLDAKLREEMRFEIRELQARTKVTVIYVTHDQAEAMVLSNRIAVMDHGGIQQVGAPTEIYLQPATPFVAGFIGLTNLLRGRVVGRDQGRCRVLLDGCRPDEEVVCDGILAPGQEATVSLRPEDAVVAAGDGLRGRILSTVFLGDRVDYRLRIGSQEIRAFGPARASLGVGEEVRIRVGYALAFPPQEAGGPEASTTGGGAS